MITATELLAGAVRVLEYRCGPGARPDYSPTDCAAFLIDPDGNNVEAVRP